MQLGIENLVPEYMDSQLHNSKLPVIEFNDENSSPGTISWESTSISVRRALESYGCFVATYEKMSSQLHTAMFGLSEELFGLPLETKKKHTATIPASGYGNFSVMPLFEYFGIEDGTTYEAANNFTRLMWPAGNDIFCEATFSYSKVLLELHKAVMQLLLSSYGLEKHYESLIESTFYMTRLMRYKSAGKNEINNVGLIPHRDKSFMAIIGTNEVDGLEIETRDGQWIEFKPSSSSFIVIVGEPLMAWSNGRLYCPLHRVVSPKGIKEKYSVALFSVVRGMLQVPDELVDDENPLKFRPFSNFEFLDYCNEVQKMNGAIQEYCGI